MGVEDINIQCKTYSSDCSRGKNQSTCLNVQEGDEPFREYTTDRGLHLPHTEVEGGYLQMTSTQVHV